VQLAAFDATASMTWLLWTQDNALMAFFHDTDRSTVMFPISKTVGWSLAVLPVLLLAVVAARPQQSPILGYVDSDQIIQQMPGYAAADSTFQNESEEWRVELQQLQSTLDSAVRAFDQESAALSDSVRDQRMEELQQMSRLVQQRNSELSQRAENRWSELVVPLQERGRAVIDGLRAERNLALVLDINAPGIVSVDPALDLTAVVLSRLRGGS
jgi:outer membrane protein